MLLVDGTGSDTCKSVVFLVCEVAFLADGQFVRSGRVVLFWKSVVETYSAIINVDLWYLIYIFDINLRDDSVGVLLFCFQITAFIKL
ncbi:hypothetical protein D9M71_822300 [compost metagenome]